MVSLDYVYTVENYPVHLGITSWSNDPTFVSLPLDLKHRPMKSLEQTETIIAHCSSIRTP